MHYRHDKGIIFHRELYSKKAYRDAYERKTLSALVNEDLRFKTRIQKSSK